ncbi:MAG TPA: sigma-70 family RNA polymerase sigma factor, partial [Polyangiaceae bacterium]|nr:sigma-70 family RNA polymerase sigma factor [Polyangiaceae bacterium]
VYRAYVRGVDGYLRALARAARCPELAQPSAVADSLQEVFVRAFSPAARANYDSQRPYRAYLHKIAKNCFLDQVRARRRANDYEIVSLPDPEASVTPEPDQTVDPRVNLVLATYLASLPPELKGVYEQRFVLGKSQEHACAVLGITRRRLRTDEARLKTGLRRALVREGVLRSDLIASASLAKVKGSDAL